jgi:hypothetical protein
MPQGVQIVAGWAERGVLKNEEYGLVLWKKSAESIVV